jgi:hypothetical protein
MQKATSLPQDDEGLEGRTNWKIKESRGSARNWNPPRSEKLKKINNNQLMMEELILNKNNQRARFGSI